MIRFQAEKWADFLPDAEQLFPLHWNELALDQDKISADMDHERYLKLDEMGMLHTTTAREGSRLVGYAVNFLITHMHYKSAGMMALADMYFVLPEFRRGGCGIRLFRVMEEQLKRRGVVRAHISCKVHQDHQELFEKLGWQFSDKTFSKYIKA